MSKTKVLTCGRKENDFFLYERKNVLPYVDASYHFASRPQQRSNCANQESHTSFS